MKPSDCAIAFIDSPTECGRGALREFSHGRIFEREISGPVTTIRLSAVQKNRAAVKWETPGG